MKTNTLRDFDSLPNAAAVDVRTVAALCGCNVSTVWERAKSGTLPSPIKIGGSTRWNVGALRAVLAGQPLTAETQ
ncbi:helix-turn-helix transcriptional regulator [Paraburkholderia sacchari]|uniref:helix-turn-helix transcriptional regulator n=1 Tax=Paraburkholderia sacchari TaxID=159450 RepID=UPI003D97FB90